MLKRSFPLFIVATLVCAFCVFVPGSVVYAIDTPTYNVSFVAPDNSILYETGDYVPESTTLAELQASNLSGNSGFVGLNGSYNRGENIYTSEYGRLLSWLTLPVIITDDYALLSTNQNQVLQYLFTTTEYNNSNITATFCYSTDNITYNIYSLTRLGAGNSYFSGTDFATQLYINSHGYLYWNLTIFVNKPLYLKYFKIEVGESFTGFFDVNYIDSKLASYNSGSSNYEYNYDLSSPIISDKFYYPANIVNNYELGYQDGLAYATSLYGGFGIFNSATWYITLYPFVNDYNNPTLISDFYGRFNTTDFDSYQGGFHISYSLANRFTSYISSSGNQSYDTSTFFYILFDSPVSTSIASSFTFLDFNFNNSYDFLMSDKSVISFDSSNSVGYADLSSCSSYILAIRVNYTNWHDYSNFGIVVNTDISSSYFSGYSDGFTYGRSEGYQNGYNDGKAVGFTNGYQSGVNEAGDYTFFSLISSVIDAPLKALTGLLNFELLGVNLLSLFTGLLTLALLLWILKLCLGGK